MPKNANNLFVFAANLRIACGYYPSIAEVCRRTGLNRPQVNRYLAAQSEPSNHTLRRLTEFFGVHPRDWWLPSDRFQRAIDAVRNAPEGKTPAASTSRYVQRVVQSQASSGPLLHRYIGGYLMTYFSMSHPGYVIRSLLILRSDSSGVSSVRLERLGDIDAPSRPDRCRYHGSVMLLNERIFLLEAETLTGNELTHTILFPTYRNRITCLNGLMIGVSASNRRLPRSARVHLEFIGQEFSTRQALRQCGLYRADDQRLEQKQIAHIRNDEHADPWHFVATTLD